MNMNLERLRRLSEMARSDAEEERNRVLAEGKRQEELQRKNDELKADLIIQQISSRAETEASAGRNHAIVMSLNYNDYKQPERVYNECKPEWLTSLSATTVYAYCVEEGFEPTIEFWHDGMGVNSGFNIVVHW